MVALVRALRPLQWVKNLFVVAPALFARRALEPESVVTVALAVACWCALASAVYLFNDLRDLEEDRRHPEKAGRPLASGALSATTAVAAAAVLTAAALLGGFWLHAYFGGALAAYAALNLAYGFGLKRVVILDVMVVASGFVLRVLSGAWVLSVTASSWLVVCTALLALFLGFAKRRQELVRSEDGRTDGATREVLSQYSVPFLDLIQTVLAAATAIAYALYCLSPETVAHVGDHRMLVTAPFVLYGLLRYLWLVQVRGVGENPTRVAVRDPGILVTVVLWVGAASVALYVDW